ncbi:MAG TPA: hypothetical protein VF220_01435 [Nitrososphaeraceae archaeon]
MNKDILVNLPDININYDMDVKTDSKEAEEVVNAWGLGERNNQVIVKDFIFNLYKNSIYYFCGYSGSGKSSILQKIAEILYNDHKAINLKYITDYKKFVRLEADDDKLVIDFLPKIKYENKIKILSRCGLLEAWKFVTPLGKLSDGEKFRFVLYYIIGEVLLDSAFTEAIIIFDEFASTLDRITAKAIAENITKIIQYVNETFSINLTFILASTHEDLINHINADYVYFKEFSPKVKNVVLESA